MGMEEANREDVEIQKPGGGYLEGDREETWERILVHRGEASDGISKMV
jgi:hypothetical protein